MYRGSQKWDTQRIRLITSSNTSDNQYRCYDQRIHKDIKCRLKSGNACYHSVQHLLSSTLLSKNVEIEIYRTIILPVVLYGCMKEECRLRVFKNRVLRWISGPKRDEVTGHWRRLHNKELYALYYSPNIIRVIVSRKMRWARNVARMREGRNAYRVLVGKPERRRPFGIPRLSYEDNIRMDLWEVEWGIMEWIGLAEDRNRWRVLVNEVKQLQSFYASLFLV